MNEGAPWIPSEHGVSAWDRPSLASSPGSGPVGALVPFEPSDPVGASPVGALALFDPSRPRWRRTAPRLTPSVSAICRSECPAAANDRIPCDLCIARRFAIGVSSESLVVHTTLTKTHPLASCHLVLFQRPMTQYADGSRLPADERSAGGA
jgi:hypothetical protein